MFIWLATKKGVKMGSRRRKFLFFSSQAQITHADIMWNHIKILSLLNLFAKIPLLFLTWLIQEKAEEN
jgi:hypothetical protein